MIETMDGQLTAGGICLARQPTMMKMQRRPRTGAGTPKIDDAGSSDSVQCSGDGDDVPLGP